LELPELIAALKNIEYAKKKDAYICIESYRNEHEKWNLMRWQLTCECFYTPREWVWIFEQAGYTGDYEFIFFV
jgi:protein-L-isoaspartate(D-aspartate) O-methyltransferase